MITASVLVPPTSMPMRRPVPMTRPHGLEVEVVAEGAGPHRTQPLRRRPDRRRGEGDDVDALAVPDALGDDSVARVDVEQRDDVRNRRQRLAVLQDDQVLVLELQAEQPPLVAAEALDERRAADEATAGAPL